MTLEIMDLAEVPTEQTRAFLHRVSEGDRTFFRQDLLEPGLIEAWEAEAIGWKFAAREGDQVLGLLSISRGFAWSIHVGDIQIVVDTAARRRGIGKALARHSLLAGVRLGLTKLVVQVAAEDEATTRMFVGLAFEPEALLRAHVRDDEGVPHDLLVLSHFVDDTRETMSALGFADALGA